MNTSEMLDYLNREGNLAVPCSRYGSDTFTCSPVAVAASLAFEDATGEPIDLDGLDYMMGLVVNDHDDIEYLIDNYTPMGGSVEL